MINGDMKRTICFAEFELDTAHRRLMREGEQVVLNPKAFDLLVFLAENRGRVVTKDEILDGVWDGQFVEEANLTVQMSTLRKALGEKKNSPQFLVTVPGKGYEFIADIDIQNGSNDIVIEKHKFSRLIVEEELEEGEREKNYSSELKPRGILFYSLPLAFLLFLGVGGFVAINKNLRGFFANAATEKHPTIKKLTSSGKVANAVLSPDGKFFAYAEHDKPNWETSIRLGQIDGGSDVVLRPADGVVYRVSAFSTDGAWLYYTASEPRDLDNATLFKMPALGGVPQKLVERVSTYCVLSPDEKRIAFVRNDKKEKTSTLLLANIDGTDQRELTARPIEKAFFPGSLSWSPDDKLIALSAANSYNENDYSNQGYEVFTVSTEDGQISQLTTLEWSGMNRVEWLKDGRALAVTARKKDTADANAPPRRSLWLIDYPDGAARKISVDLNDYAGSVSLTTDAKSLLVVQGQSESNVWVAPIETLLTARQITFGSPGRIDGWYGIDWTADGRIVYAAFIGESSTIWKMDADGGHAEQLTPIGFRDAIPSVTADGAFIVFQSNRSGKMEIWRMRTDGSDLRQITSGDGINSNPSVTPDGSWIFYMNERGGQSSVWRVTADGREAVRLVDGESSYPRVSPDGKYFACGYVSNGKTMLAIFPISGGAPVMLLDVPKTYNFTNAIRWKPDGKSISYRDWANGIWEQSVEGGEPHRIAGLPEEKLMTYGWSRDGKYLAFTRGKQSLDAVLISDFR